MTSLNDINEKYKSEFTMDDPVEVNTIKVYPIRMRDYFKFLSSVSILKIKKNSIPDPKIISMSYIEYILYLLEKKDELSKVYSFLLYTILSLSCNDKDIVILYGRDENKKVFIQIKDVRFYKEEFDELRDVILAQNLPDYEENYINPELEADLEEADRIRNGNSIPCSIEKHMIAVTIGSSLSLEDVKNTTIRKFKIMLEMIDKKMHYVMLKTASYSGMVTFKEEIKHYLVEDDNKFENKIMYYDELQNKINGARP